MCCVVFSRSCFIQTENNINHMTTNKTNIWLEGDGRSRAVAPCVPPQRCFECQSSRDSASAFVRTSPRFSDPFPLTLRSSWKRRRLWRSTEGARWTLCRFGLCMFQLAVHLAKQQRKKSKILKCSSGLQLSSISNRSYKQQYVFYFSFLCAMFFPVFFVFSVFSFFVFHLVLGGARLKSFSTTGTRRPHKAS